MPAPVAGADAGWFKIDGTQRSAWRAEPVDPSGLRLRLTRVGPIDGGSSKHALVVYGRASPAYDLAINAMLAEFADSGRSIAVEVVNYDGDATAGARFFADAAADDVALIFAMGSEATALAVSVYKGGPVPVVSVCAKDPVLLGQIADYTHGSGTNLAFTSLNPPMDQQLAYLTKLKPDLKAIGVLVDGKNLSAVRTQAEPLAVVARRSGITVIPIAVENPKAIEEELAKRMPPALERMRQADPGLSNSLLWLTGSTALFNAVETINQLSENVPLVSAVPELVRSGPASAVISIGVTFESNGQLAARYGLDILMGKTRAGTMPVGLISPPDISINARRAREIRFKVPFEFLETANYLYDSAGRLRRQKGQPVAPPGSG